MPDPIITPLAAFGLASTILSHLISTAQNLHGKYHEIKDFPEVFGAYGRIVYDSSLSYALWQRLWHRSNEAAYNGLFGTHGWIVIKAAIQDVERLIRETTDSLSLRKTVSEPAAEGSMASTHVSTIRRATSTIKSGLKSPVRFARHLGWVKPKATESLRHVPIDLEADDSLKWQIFTGALEGYLVASYKPEELVLKRIIGFLGPNQDLEKKIKALEKAVAVLEKLTSNTFRLMGHGSEPKELDEVEAVEDTITFRAVARDLNTLIRNQTAAMAAAAAAGTGTGASGEKAGSWFLELGFPNGTTDGSVAVSRIIRNCDISLVARTSELPGTSTKTRELKLKRLRGIFEDEDADVCELTVAMEKFHKKAAWTVSMPGQPGPPVYQLDWSGSAPEILMKDWRTLLGACSRKQHVRKALELERAHFALGLSLWFILLWETEWFDHVCSCAFRCLLFSDPSNGDDGKPSRRRQEHVYASSVLQQRQHAPPPKPSCRGQVKLNHRLYHLGILLAELALATPIHLTSDLDQPCRPINTVGRPTGQFKRIREIRNHTEIPLQLQGAIEFCLDEAEEERWSAETKGLAAHRVKDFLEKVVKPVKQYHDVVKENFSYASQFTALAREYRDDEFKMFGDA